MTAAQAIINAALEPEMSQALRAEIAAQQAFVPAEEVRRETAAKLMKDAQRAKALENRVEQVYREALANLFNGPRDVDHVVEMLKLREIYRHLSNAADRGDEAANVITDIVVKMASY